MNSCQLSSVYDYCVCVCLCAILCKVFLEISIFVLKCCSFSIFPLVLLVLSNDFHRYSVYPWDDVAYFKFSTVYLWQSSNLMFQMPIFLNPQNCFNATYSDITIINIAIAIAYLFQPNVSARPNGKISQHIDWLI